jgi:hypothetical protein
LENEKSRKIVGFDMFGEFPNGNNLESDEQFINNWNKQFQNEFLTEQDIYASLDNKNIHNVELVKGNILVTIEKYIEKNPHTRIALLHIDVDVYGPAKKALDLLFDRVVKGGVVVFDDYGTVEGETVAIDEFFKDKEYSLKKFSFSHTKPSYLIKK